MAPPDEEGRAIGRIVEWLRPEMSLLFITGAGLSADSGLPTYRGIGGLYQDERPVVDGIPIEVALSGGMMAVRPEVTWAYLLELERACRGATFNRGHEVIAEMERHFPRVWTLTQNVDGFHRAAGSRNVIDIHGDLHTILCPRCDYREGLDDFEGLMVPPPCPCCSTTLRPDVVLFGEALPESKVETLDRELAVGFDLVFSIGTSSLFPYISEPVLIARSRGTPTIEINPGQSEVSALVDVKVSGKAAGVLDALWNAYRSRPTA